MRMSIVGLPFAGKSTFYEILTTKGMSGSASGKKGAAIATVSVPDQRLDRLSEVYQPKKHTPAALEFIDTPGMSLEGQGRGFAGGTLEEVKRADAMILMVQDFDSPMAPHPKGSVDAARDIEFILSEFVMADYIMLEKRAERLRKEVQVAKKTENVRELEAVEKVLAVLEQEKPANTLDLTDNERKVLSPYQLLTLRPLLIVLNVGEDKTDTMDARAAEVAAGFPDYTFMAMCASLESELAQMDPAEAEEFMADLGLSEPAFDRIIAKCFNILGLKVFFTVGRDECRAWPVAAAATAYESAAAIHSDLQRGFIRAVVMPYAEFAANPQETTFKEKGREQKKDYFVADGDIMEIRSGV